MLYNPTQPIESKHLPKISVSSSGLITATCDDVSTTKQLTKQAATTITPGTSAKTAVAAGRYTTGAVKVAGDANLVAGNIKSGVSIFGVNGSLAASPSIVLHDEEADIAATVSKAYADVYIAYLQSIYLSAIGWDRTSAVCYWFANTISYSTVHNTYYEIVNISAFRYASDTWTVVGTALKRSGSQLSYYPLTSLPNTSFTVANDGGIKINSTNTDFYGLNGAASSGQIVAGWRCKLYTTQSA